jgi:hypothetical protein
LKEQRQFTRIPFDATVQLSVGNNSWDADLVDISLKGALITKPDTFDNKSNESGALTLHLPDCDIELHLNVTLIHIEEETIGMRCDYIDVDSMTHLRRIIEFNTGQPDLLYRELSALGH